MSSGIYMEKLSSYELENMDASELKERIRKLEDELDEKLTMNDVTVRVMCEYIRDIEQKLEFTRTILSLEREEFDEYREKIISGNGKDDEEDEDEED